MKIQATKGCKVQQVQDAKKLVKTLFSAMPE